MRLSTHLSSSGSGSLHQDLLLIEIVYFSDIFQTCIVQYGSEQQHATSDHLKYSLSKLKYAGVKGTPDFENLG